MSKSREDEEDRSSIIEYKTCDSYISDLPRDILMKILSCVCSLTTIVRCRCLCKAWHDMLLDPYFAHMHFSRAREQRYFLMEKPLDFGGGRGFNTSSPRSRCFRLLNFHQEEGSSSYTYDDIKLFTLKYKLPKSYSPQLVGSCNGLLCFMNSCDRNEPLYFSNPLTMEYVILPTMPPINNVNNIVVYGFGFSPTTNQYKVIQLHRSNPWSDKRVAWTAMVHTLGTGIWRNIGIVPYALHDHAVGCSTFPVVYFNGTLNWIASYSSNGSILICSFDLETENFGALTVLVLPTIDRGRYHLNLGVFGDYLCTVYSPNCSGIECEIWVLQKENHDQEYSWIKKLIIEDNRVLKMVTVQKNEEIAFISSDSLTLYYSRNGSSRIFNNYELMTIVAHIPSFISLKDVAAMGEDWKVIKAKSIIYIE